MSTFINFLAPQTSVAGSANAGTAVAGGATTFALGEEGGTVTTQAIGEEGGFTGSTRTQDYIDFFRQADARGGGGRGDGVLSRAEISAQLDFFTRQRDFVNRFAGFIPSFRPFFDPLLQNLDSQIKVGNRMLNNYAQIADASADGVRFIANGQIGEEDIRAAARRDGNEFDLSDRDLRRSGSFDPGSFLNEFRDLFRRFFGGLFG